MITQVVEWFVSLSRPCSHGLHHLSLVPPAHALWQHLIHRWVCHPAGLKSLHSPRSPGRCLFGFRLWYREGINLYITSFNASLVLVLSPFPKSCVSVFSKNSDLNQPPPQEKGKSDNLTNKEMLFLLFLPVTHHGYIVLQKFCVPVMNCLFIFWHLLQPINVVIICFQMVMVGVEKPLLL